MSVPTHHGAYKTPGGKLVVVDFDVADGRLRHVEVSGDFFLYPEEALPAIAGALEGAAVDLTQSELAFRVTAALPNGAELLGSSPEGIATAVWRGLHPDAEEA